MRFRVIVGVKIGGDVNRNYKKPKVDVVVPNSVNKQDHPGGEDNGEDNEDDYGDLSDDSDDDANYDINEDIDAEAHSNPGEQIITLG